MTDYFTSDWHLGHQFVAGLRGFDSVREHDEAVMDACVAKVGPKDSLWMLGDLTCSDKEVERALDWVSRIGAQKVHLVGGNHDPVHPMHRQAWKWQRQYLMTFDSVQAFARRKIAGKALLLSHFPYHGDTGDYEERYTQYRLRDEGQLLLHGHTHSGQVVSEVSQMHIGLDAWGLSPVSIDEIGRAMELAGWLV